ncbi:MAG: nitrilase-related carbon-nitrogen hydrolase, partial [Candidatus Hydrogenedentales bacterium]
MSRLIPFASTTSLRLGGAFAIAAAAVALVAWSLTPPPPSTQFDPPSKSLPIGKRDVQIVAVQMTWKPEDFSSESAYRTRVDGLIQQGLKQAHRNTPILFVFPEDIGAPLFFLNHLDDAKKARTLTEATAALGKRHMAEVFLRSWFGLVSYPRAIALTRAAKVGKTYVDTFSSLSRKHAVFIVAGSAPMPDFPIAADGSSITYAPESNQVYNVSYFFGPDGRIIGRQHKVNLIPLEQEDGLDLSPGKLEDLRVFDTEFGSIGIAIC